MPATIAPARREEQRLDLQATEERSPHGSDCGPAAGRRDLFGDLAPDDHHHR